MGGYGSVGGQGGGKVGYKSSFHAAMLKSC